ncbi:MAG: hypothetical protein KDB62_04500 [Solirubrobacterales bacterium]|nr:hypothetical protein [Solirubrobacterales bacterium]
MDTITKSNRVRLLVLALTIFASGAALAACGGSDHEKRTGIVEGERFEMGPLEYNVLFTRPLNPSDVEDKEYLVGQPEPGPDQSYIGVFLQAENLDEDDAHALPGSFKLVDTEGNTFENLESESSYALRTGADVGPEDVVPALDSTPEVGPIEASMLLFLVDDPSLEKRPIELEVDGEDGPASVELDL